MKTALIVDDDIWLADSYRLILQTAGWKVALARNGAEAVDSIDQSQPDVVLLDIMLPGSSAPALLNELQSHSDLADLPVVLCSSLNIDQHSFSHLREYGVRHVIDKTTTTPAAIVSTLEGALRAVT